MENKTNTSLELEDYRAIMLDPASNTAAKAIARRKIFEICDKREEVIDA